jgi:hypothetical protein
MMDWMDLYDSERPDRRGGMLDALARAELLSGDPALDRRFAVLADADPLGLQIPRRPPGCAGPGGLRDNASPERQAYPLPMPTGPGGARQGDTDA